MAAPESEDSKLQRERELHALASTVVRLDEGNGGGAVYHIVREALLGGAEQLTRQELERAAGAPNRRP